MPTPNLSSPPICPDCDGFPVVAITTGTRQPNGQRTTITVDCRACNGTGTTPARRPVRLSVSAGVSC
ncbi:hypothetical protein [Streptomyces sp. SPB162]|uniref:hypothetical protein n=1 Tax=Streptomyces sp. SPB162 TaxID=2940560 RepID=UPI00240556CA|nr:hypothetical protein [Streptomyces sp. SPB162]MDF9817230.1 DnaJ-class molecular chaperone [Streptomyces sp. SPB162]